MTGAGDRDRTGTGLLSPRDFKSLASAYSATPANGGLYHSDPGSLPLFSFTHSHPYPHACQARTQEPAIWLDWTAGRRSPAQERVILLE